MCNHIPLTTTTSLVCYSDVLEYTSNHVCIREGLLPIVEMCIEFVPILTAECSVEVGEGEEESTPVMLRSVPSSEGVEY